MVNTSTPEQVHERFRELQAQAYERRLKASLAKTNAKTIKDMAFLMFLGALVAAIVWVGCEIWIG